MTGVTILPAFVATVAALSSAPLADLGPAPAVELIDQQGRPFRLADLKGRCVLVSFIYTTCNGVCPATTHNLYRVREALEAAGLGGDRVAIVSITLDPENDTPEALARYARIYGCDPVSWHFLTGPPETVERVWKSWDMWSRRDPETGVLDHPSRIFLIDPEGRRREIYSLQYLTPQDVLRDVRSLLGT